jgi:RimJ/RimL family protein N-acetyltransferase
MPDCKNAREHPMQYNRLSGTLRGKQVWLRPPTRDEVSFVQALWADPETMEAVGGPHPLPTEKFDRWFAYAVDPGRPTDCYCLIFNQDDTPIGEVSFHQWDPDERSAVLNIKVMAKYRGHGYGTDALKTFLSWFFGQAGGDSIMDDVARENETGRQLLRSIGFQQVTDRDPAQDCRAEDVYMLDMTREMFTSKYG